MWLEVIRLVVRCGIENDRGEVGFQPIYGMVVQMICQIKTIRENYEFLFGHTYFRCPPINQTSNTRSGDEKIVQLTIKLQTTQRRKKSADVDNIITFSIFNLQKCNRFVLKINFSEHGKQRKERATRENKMR